MFEVNSNLTVIPSTNFNIKTNKQPEYEWDAFYCANTHTHTFILRMINAIHDTWQSACKSNKDRRKMQHWFEGFGDNASAKYTLYGRNFCLLSLSMSPSTSKRRTFFYLSRNKFVLELQFDIRQLSMKSKRNESNSDRKTITMQ